MRNIIYKSAALILVSISMLCSCEKEIKFVGSYDGPKLVVMCCANSSSDTIVANFTKSRFFLDDTPGDVREGLTGVTATLEVSGQTFRFTEDKDTKGKYICLYHVKEGDRLTLKASCEGLKSIESSITVPHRPQIEVTSWEEVKDFDEYQYYLSKPVKVKATIYDTPGQMDYYRLLAFQKSSTEVNLVSGWSSDILFSDMSPDVFDVFDDYFDSEPVRYQLGGMFDDSNFDTLGKNVTFKLNVQAPVEDLPMYTYNPETGEYELDYDYEFNYEDFEWTIQPGSLSVQLEAISEDLYKFSVSKDLAYDTDDFFSEPVAIHNNIKGGIGCFGAIAPVMVSIN